jgi:hypothetical protein
MNIKRLLSPFWGTKIEYHLTCTPEDVVEALKSKVVTFGFAPFQVWTWDFWVRFCAFEPRFFGLFFKRRFRITYADWYHNSFQPVLWGRIVQTNTGCSIYGTIRLSKVVILFSLIWNLFFILIPVVGWVFNLAFLAIYAGCLSMSKESPQKIRDLLDQSLKEKMIPTPLDEQNLY